MELIILACFSDTKRLKQIETERERESIAAYHLTKTANNEQRTHAFWIRHRNKDQQTRRKKKKKKLRSRKRKRKFPIRMCVIQWWQSRTANNQTPKHMKKYQIKSHMHIQYSVNVYGSRIGKHRKYWNIKTFRQTKFNRFQISKLEQRFRKPQHLQINIFRSYIFS